MASYKTFFLICALSTNIVAGLPKLVQSTPVDDSKLLDIKKYNFPDNYFNVKAHQYADKQRQSTENCEQVIKNGMICQVCTDPDTNAKYEQCSYASPSSKRAAEYKKPKTIPEKYEKINYDTQSKKHQASKPREYSEESDESDISSRYSLPYFTAAKKYDNDDDNDSNMEYDESSKFSYVPESERISKNIKKHKCEEIERDGMICMVCKDLKTGGNFEKCSYVYQPKEKVYKYSTSKSSGGPKDKKTKKKPIEKSQSYRRSDSSETTTSDASQVTETQQVDDNGCRDVIKDSMKCKVCVHPVTRENSEQCSYSYRPDDKLYAYTHSSSFGSPKQKYSTSDFHD